MLENYSEFYSNCNRNMKRSDKLRRIENRNPLTEQNKTMQNDNKLSQTRREREIENRGSVKFQNLR